MRTIVVAALLALVGLFSTPDSSQALTIGNAAAITQTNVCENCVGVDQSNVALIFQSIIGHDYYVYTPGPGVLNPGWFSSLLNVAAVFQNNFCAFCGPDVTQANTAFVVQQINVGGTFSGPGPTITPGLPATEVGNLAFVDQYNECVNCEDVSQSNYAYIFQNISLDEKFKRFFGGDFALLNLAEIIQENFCVVDCAHVIQENIAGVSQNITVPAPGAFLLLGSGLAGLLVFGRKKISGRS